MSLDVDLVFDEAELLEHIDVLLNRRKIGPQIRLAIEIVLGESPVEPLGRDLEEARENGDGFLVIGGVEIPARRPHVVLVEIDERGPVLGNETGARGQKKEIAAADGIA